MELPQQMLNTLSTDLAEINLSPVNADAQQVAYFEQQMQQVQPTGILTEGMGSDAVKFFGRIQQRIGDAQTNLALNLSQPDISPQSLLKVQFDMMKIHTAIDLVAKTAGRISQSVETLQKMQ